MRFRKYQVDVYDDQSIVIRNPETGAVTLLTDEEASALRYMESVEIGSVLDVLLPEAGIAKKDHISASLSVIAKMKHIGLLDLPAIDARIKSDTLTMELELSRKKIRFIGLDSLAATLCGLFGKIFSIFRSIGILILTTAFSAYGILFFPFDNHATFFSSGPSYSALILGTYIFICLALSFRSVLQLAFLKANGRDVDDVRFSFFGPFIYMRAIGSANWLLGVRGRFLYAMVGLFAPIFLSGMFVALYSLHLVSVVTVWTAFTASVGTFLMLLCPLLRAEGAEILNIFFYRYNPRASASLDARDALLQKSKVLSRPAGAALLLSLVWFLFYLDLLRAYWDVWAFRVVPVLLEPVNSVALMGAAVVAAGFLSLALLPPVACFVLLLKGILQKRHKSVVVPLPAGASQELDFDEQMSALENVPLFAALNSQDRLALFNEMQLVTFKADDYLVRQGEIGHEFFVLIRGKARAIFQDFKGKKHTVNSLQEGDAFGEIALLDDVPRTASVVSTTVCNVLVLRKSSFDKVVQNLGSPEKVKQMIRLTSFFRRHPLFSKLSPREQADLIHAFNFELLAPGDEVVEDATGDHFYVVYSGVLQVDTGDDATDTTIESDDCFGYAKGIHTKITSADGAGLLRIRKDEFDALIWQKLVERPDLFI